ncbi:hypothetical protein BZG02_08070 [Labilibaculum filiforme]|uniref:Uncharacterized protein n=1 Tax=Labilibaculum filiforme TaxID=1940526 RepID=A0A2N3I0V8_9BACT|nr:hypothetical protein [Labilibaculum filiforme]PKQ63959.1 hypothetical protein BZG02_08070 [Labilibaculum filiforme]
MSNKKMVVIVLSLILILSISAVLVINGFPELTPNWSVESKSILKQYIKLFGFLSVMGLVYILVEGLKMAKVQEQEIEDEIK